MIEIQTFSLSKLIELLQSTGKTYLCNAIGAHFSQQGLRCGNITFELRRVFMHRFPNEFRPLETYSGVMEYWLIPQMQERFFSYDVETGVFPDLSMQELHDCRINFLQYLMENYGDVKLELEMELHPE